MVEPYKHVPVNMKTVWSNEGELEKRDPLTFVLDQSEGIFELSSKLFKF